VKGPKPDRQLFSAGAERRQSGYAVSDLSPVNHEPSREIPGARALPSTLVLPGRCFGLPPEKDWEIAQRVPPFPVALVLRVDDGAKEASHVDAYGCPNSRKARFGTAYAQTIGMPGGGLAGSDKTRPSGGATGDLYRSGQTPAAGHQQLRSVQVQDPDRLSERSVVQGRAVNSVQWPQVNRNCGSRGPLKPAQALVRLGRGRNSGAAGGL
jgi:hypothetical protein